LCCFCTVQTASVCVEVTHHQHTHKPPPRHVRACRRLVSAHMPFTLFLPSSLPSVRLWRAPPPLHPLLSLLLRSLLLSHRTCRHHVGPSHVSLVWRWIPKQETDATFARGSCLQGAAGSISPSLPPVGRAACSFDPPPPCLAPITPTSSLAQFDMDDSASENPRCYRERREF
jgi:hypothetical protein